MKRFFSDESIKKANEALINHETNLSHGLSEKFKKIIDSVRDISDEEIEAAWRKASQDSKL